MNPELQKEIALWLTQLRGGAELVLAQAPGIVQEKVAYSRASDTAFLGVFLLAAYGIYRGVRAVYRLDRNEYDAERLGGYIALGIASFVDALLILMQADACLKVWLAPRVYILDWLASLVK